MDRKGKNGVKYEMNTKIAKGEICKYNMEIIALYIFPFLFAKQIIFNKYLAWDAIDTCVINKYACKLRHQ